MQPKLERKLASGNKDGGQDVNAEKNLWSPELRT
jgi:hypothetical protein